MGLKKLLIFTLVILSVAALSKSFSDYQAEFISYRDSHDAKGMKELINELEKLPNKDYRAYTLLADSLVEYALWGAKEGEDKKSIYEKARKYAEKAIDLNPKYAYAYFVRGAAIGRLAQYVGLLKSLFMVDDFDYSMKKAIELDPKCFRAMVAMGMRYRDLPWPFRSYKKAEKYFKRAIEVEPRYINSYLELGILYEAWKKKDKAIKMFMKVLELPPMKGFTALGKEAKEEAQKHLKALGG